MRQITGTLFSYSYLCWKKTWYFAKGIQMESFSQEVKIGKLIDEQTYREEDKHLMIDNYVNLDFYKDHIVHEIKKSGAEKEIAIQQIKYYLYILKNKGVRNAIGELLIPAEKSREKIFLELEDIKEIEQQLKKIQELIALDQPPIVNEMKRCKKCAYFDLCQL
ncbi:MAG: CRISPR-associated protein Cas4 [Turicibacter sp.]|nr:CRISPR-associated protein Cas4 [Turicibacter sp.]